MKKYAIIILISFVFTLGLATYKLYLAVSHPIKYENIISSYARQYDLSSVLVASVINVESSYDSSAKSNKNALGLMQIKLTTAEYMNDWYNIDTTLEETDLYSAEINIKYGCLYLRYLLDKFEDTYTALSAYNAGETRVRTWLYDENISTDGKTLSYIPYKETREYIKKIKNNMKFYQKIYKN